ncbi:MAG: ComEC/Rec2 family competence protein [Bacteroidota bacterium]
MFFWTAYPFVRFAIALTAGILLFEHLPDLWSGFEVVSVTLLLLLAFLVWLGHRIGFFRLRILYGVLAMLLLVLLGGYRAQEKYHTFGNNHYLYVLRAQEEIEGFSGVISSVPNAREKYHRYNLDLKLIRLDSSVVPAAGTIHIYIEKDSTEIIPFVYGDQIMVEGGFFQVSKPGNPAEFDYKAYLKKQNIYAHAFTKGGATKKVSNQPPNKLLQWAYHIRKRSAEIIDQYIPEKRENSIIQALVLGIKDHLDTEIKEAYSSAGAMHVLAVSGLHVGIVYLIIQMLLGKLSSRGIWGKVTFCVSSVLVIWFYAMVTGLSPSVLRAATMFSAIAVGKAFSKETNVYNTLGVAAFFLLCYDPYLIYSVGFQLSFAAVFGIVYLQPKLYSLIKTRYLIVDKIWAITCVSISAQMATFPLSAYYFHQFPTYFLVSNLVVIPGATVLLILGIFMLALGSFFPAVGMLLGRILYYVLWSMNESIYFLDQFPGSLIEWIYLDKHGLVLIYGSVITLVCGLHFRSFKTLTLSAFCLVIFLGSIGWRHHIQSGTEQLVVYDIDDYIAIDHINGHDASLYLDRPFEKQLDLLSYQIDPYRLSLGLKPIHQTTQLISETFKSHEVFRQGMIGSTKIFLVDSTTFHLEIQEPIETDILILNNGAVKSVEWLNQNFNYQYLIVSNKNSDYYSRKMIEQAQKQETKLHVMRDHGAFVLDKRHKKRADLKPALFTTNPD